MEIRFQMIDPHTDASPTEWWHGAVPKIDKMVLVILKQNENNILIAKRVKGNTWLAADVYEGGYLDYINFYTDDVYAWGFLESKEQY